MWVARQNPRRYLGIRANQSHYPWRSVCHPWTPVESTFLRSLEEKNGFKKKVFWFSSKIHDKRCFNVQRHHPNQQISPTRPENVPKYKGFCIDFRSSRRHSMTIWCLCTLKHRLSRILHFLFSGFFLSRAMICVMLKITFPALQTGPINRSEKSDFFLHFEHRGVPTSKPGSVIHVRADSKLVWALEDFIKKMD